MMRNSARVLALFLAVFPAATLALGLGNVEVSTTLNEPLRAEIPLTGLKPGEIEDVDIRLGSEAQFRRAGLDRPFHLSRIRFTVVPEGEGGPHVALTTEEPVTEPFLNFLVELNWPNGRLIREYTLLLDPPVYGAAITSTVEKEVAIVDTLPEPSQLSEPVPLPVAPPQPEMIAVPAPAAPAVTQPEAQAPEVEAPAPAPTAAAPIPEPAPEPTPEPALEPQAEPAPTLAAAPAPELAGVDRYGPVVANESLWSIAERVRPDESISIQRMMLAILEANPEAFILDNINTLKRGEVLRIPGLEEIGADEKAAAMAEVRRQQAIWDDYRQQIAAAPGAAAEGSTATAGPSAEAGAETAAEPSVPPAAEAEDASRLELVGAGASEAAGAAPGDQASAAELRQQLNLALEEADSKLRENQELSERLQETEQIIGDLNRMLEFKDDEIARLQQQLAELQAQPAPEPEAAPEPETAAVPEPETAAVPEPETVAMPEPETAAMPEPETAAVPEPAPPPESLAQAQPETQPAPPPEPQAAPEPQTVTPPPASGPAPQQISFVDDLLSTARGYVPSGVDPILAAGALGLVLILSGGLVLYRRRQAAEAGTEPAAIDFEDDPDAMGAAFETADEAITDRAAGDEAAGAVTDDETVLAGDAEGAADTAGTLESGDEDPLSELNIYMAYEHFDQAEDLVRRAIADHPDNHEYRLKLLEVFYAAKDLPSFQEAARELREAVGADSPHIATAAGWWADLAPGRELFAGPAEAAGTGTATSTGEEVADDELFDVTQAEGEDTGDESRVDFDLGFEAPDEATAESDSLGSGVDFDLDSGGQEAAAEEDSSSDVDFDLGGLDEDADEGSADLAALADEPEAAAVDVEKDELDFDSGDTEAERTAAAAALSDSGLDFDLDSEDKPETASEGDALASSGLDFEFDGATSDDGLSETAADLGLNLEKFEDSDTGTGDRDDAASGEEELAIDFETGSGDEEASSGDAGLDLALEDSGDDSSEASAESGGDVDFDLGGDDVDFDLGGDEGETKGTGIDTVFKGVFDDDAPGDGAGRDDDSDDDPLGIGDGSDELPELESGTEDAVDLTFLGDAGGTDDDALSDLDFGPDESDDTEEQKTEFLLRDGNGADTGAEAESGNGSAELDDVQTKLDLAEAYIEMGDTDGARGILGEVMSEGSDMQQEQARDLLSKLG